MACGWTLLMVPQRLSWWSVFEFVKHSSPHSNVWRVRHPRHHGWGKAEMLLAALAGYKPDLSEAAATVRTLGTAIPRDEIDAERWFFGG